MECINFDAHFADMLAAWTEAHMSEYETYDQMEADVPKAYMEFLNTPAPWLRGITPGSYFTQFEDPKDLVDWMNQYVLEDVPVPELLLEQIRSVGKPCEKRLVALLKGGEGLPEAKMLAVGLLRDLGSEQPKSLYIAWQQNRQEQDELADNALESLLDMGQSAVQAMVEALPKSNDAGQEALLDVLCNYPGNEKVFQLTLKRFRETADKKALYAGYLAKLGDSRALDALIAAAKDEKLRYFDYIELRCAIEELGGDAPERDFTDDPDFDALSRM